MVEGTKMDIQLEQAVDNIQLNEVKEKMTFIHDSLVSGRDNSKLPEDIFKGYFLPYFSGQLPITRESNVLTDWISVAGTPMSEVDIIDLATGDIIFTVPSLFDTNVLDVTKKEQGHTLAEIFSRFELKNNNLPVVATAFLKDALDDKANQINASTSNQNDTRWEAILKRYGLLAIEATATNVEQDGGLDLDYD